MKRMTIYCFMLIALSMTLTTGCVVHTKARVAHSEPTTVVVAHRTAPHRVYHQGRWLYHRGNGYYYMSGPRWVRAHSVPAHVVHFHAI